MSEDTFHLGIKALVTNSDGRVLLLQVNPAELSGNNQAYWDLPGGRIQRDEDVLEALKREVLEETGIADIQMTKHLGMILSKIRIPVPDQGSVGLILSIYECQLPASADLTLSFEHLAYEWVTPNEAGNRLKVKYSDEFCDMVREL